MGFLFCLLVIALALVILKNHERDRDVLPHSLQRMTSDDVPSVSVLCVIFCLPTESLVVLYPCSCLLFAGCSSNKQRVKNERHFIGQKIGHVLVEYSTFVLDFSFAITVSCNILFFFFFLLFLSLFFFIFFFPCGEKFPK